MEAHRTKTDSCCVLELYFEEISLILYSFCTIISLQLFVGPPKVNLDDRFIRYTTFFEGRSILVVFGASTRKTRDALEKPTPKVVFFLDFDHFCGQICGEC